MGAFFTSLLGLVPAAFGLVGKFLGVQQAKVQAGQNTITQAGQIQTVEGGLTPINAIVRAMFAVPVSFYYGKIFLWDKVLGLGATDPLSPELTWTARVIICFYFLHIMVKG